jgi:hypothetical protein
MPEIGRLSENGEARKVVARVVVDKPRVNPAVIDESMPDTHLNDLISTRTPGVSRR